MMIMVLMTMMLMMMLMMTTTTSEYYGFCDYGDDGCYAHVSYVSYGFMVMIILMADHFNILYIYVYDPGATASPLPHGWYPLRLSVVWLGGFGGASTPPWWCGMVQVWVFLACGSSG